MNFDKLLPFVLTVALGAAAIGHSSINFKDGFGKLRRRFYMMQGLQPGEVQRFLRRICYNLILRELLHDENIDDFDRFDAMLEINQLLSKIN